MNIPELKKAMAKKGGTMSCGTEKIDLEALEKIKYHSTMGTFIGKFIGELIDKLRVEEEMRSELELRLAQKEG